MGLFWRDSIVWGKGLNEMVGKIPVFFALVFRALRAIAAVMENQAQQSVGQYCNLKSIPAHRFCQDFLCS